MDINGKTMTEERRMLIQTKKSIIVKIWTFTCAIRSIIDHRFSINIKFLNIDRHLRFR